MAVASVDDGIHDLRRAFRLHEKKVMLVTSGDTAESQACMLRCVERSWCRHYISNAELVSQLKITTQLRLGLNLYVLYHAHVAKNLAITHARHNVFQNTCHSGWWRRRAPQATHQGQGPILEPLNSICGLTLQRTHLSSWFRERP